MDGEFLELLICREYKGAAAFPKTKIMQDLQELFESLGTEEMDKLAELIDKKNVNPKNAQKILDHIAVVYCAEKGISEAELTKEEMDELVNSFTMNVALYKSILEGHMQIKAGRIRLTDGTSCTFSLTDEGIRHVENMIGKTKNQ